MSKRPDQDRRDLDAEAADRLARVDSPHASEADWLALGEWLEAAPAHREAFDRMERVLAEVTAAAPALVAALDARTPLAPLRRARPKVAARSFRRWAPAAAALLAASLAVAVFVGVRPAAPPPEALYQTAIGQTRELALADGSRMTLNSASRVAVSLGREARQVRLLEGEAAFKVAHDAARPFLIAAADRRVRVVGTEFDVLNHRGLVRVTVREGLVGVSPLDAPTASDAVLLKAGDQLDHRDGERVSTVHHVDPELAFAWRRGDLIYRDLPLSEVAADLSRYFATPVRVEGPASDLRFSGVLRMDTEEAVVRRLQAFLPITADRSRSAFTLRLRDSAAAR